MPTEEAARAFYNANGGSYPPVEASAPLPSEPAAAEPIAAPAPAEVAAEPLPLSPAEFEWPNAPVATRSAVDWSEPAATAQEFELEAPPGVLDTSEAGAAAMGRMRDAFAAAGAGRTLAAELFGDAVRAQTDPRLRVSQAQAEADLRREWGDRFEVRLAAASALVRKAAAVSPEIVPFLERTGLGNSPEFIKKLAVAAARRGR